MPSTRQSSLHLETEEPVLCLAVPLAYEHAIVRPDDLFRVNTAFFHINAIVSLGLLAVGVADLLL